MSPSYVIGYRDGFNGVARRSVGRDYSLGYETGRRRKVAAPLVSGEGEPVVGQRTVQEPVATIEGGQGGDATTEVRVAVGPHEGG